MDTGLQDQISLKLESTYGTAVVPDTSVAVQESDGIQVVQDVLGVETIKNSLPKNKAFFRGKANYSGGFELPVSANIIGHIFKSALGAMADSTIEASTVYKHTYTEGVSKPSLTIEQKIGQITKRFAGYVVSTLKFSSKAGELVILGFEGNAKSQADATAISAAYDTKRPLNFADVTELSIGGTDIKGKVESFEIEYNNNLTLFHGFGSRDPQIKTVKGSEAKGKMTLYVDVNTKDYLADYIAGTERQIILTVTGDAVGSSSNDILKITLPKCVITSDDIKVATDIVMMELEFEGREDPTNGLIKIELTNTVSTY